MYFHLRFDLFIDQEKLRNGVALIVFELYLYLQYKPDLIFFSL